MLSPDELRRYARQLVLPEIGVAGQNRLRASRVLIVGAGGLGSPAALYLAAAGVGHLGLVDSDVVDLTNLHRQLLHRTPDVGSEKTASAAAAIDELNPHVRVERFQERLTESRAIDLFSEFDVIVDGSDNYPTRYTVNDACAELGKPWVYGSVERFSGQLSVFGWEGGPCYRCVFPTAPEPGTTQSCEEIGVLGAVPGVIGSLQALEALKCLLRIGEPLSGKMLLFDFLAGEPRFVRFERRVDCAACGRERGGAARARTNGVHLDQSIEPAELVALVKGAATFQLLDVRERWEWDIGKIGGAELIPMSDLPANVARLDRARPVVVYCHHGVRSDTAAAWLRSIGYEASSLVGGIERWSREIDPTIARY